MPVTMVLAGGNAADAPAAAETWRPRHEGPGSASSAPTFNPFAENPLLKALSAVGGPPGSTTSVAASPLSSTGTSSPSPATVGPHGSVPHAAAGSALAAASASSGFNTPIMSSPRSDPMSVGSPLSAPVPDADHIMSIMSILEPEATQAPQQGQGPPGTPPVGYTTPPPASQQQRAGRGGYQRGPAGPAARAGGMGAAGGKDLPGAPGAVGALTGGVAHQGGGLPTRSPAESGVSSLAALSTAAASLPSLPGSALGSMAQPGSSYNIWSTSTPGSAGARPAMSWSSVPMQQQQQQQQQQQASATASKSKAAMLDWQRADAADIAAALPSSLLPASLELDVPTPAARQQQQQQQHSMGPTQNTQHMAHVGMSAMSHVSGNNRMHAAAGSVNTAAYYLGMNGNAGLQAGVPQSPANVATLRSGGVMVNASHMAQPGLGWPAASAASVGKGDMMMQQVGSAAPGSSAASISAAAAAAAAVAAAAAAGAVPLRDVQGLAAGAQGAGVVRVPLGFVGGDHVNWAHAGGRATNSTWAPFSAGHGSGGGSNGGGQQNAHISNWQRGGR